MMTHDPREALEIVQQMIRGKPMEAWITDIRTMKSLGDVVQEALTASPGEQEPFGWVGSDGKFLLPSGATREQFLSNFEDVGIGTPLVRVYLSPPPAAGWNEAINWLEGIARNDGNADQLAAQRCVAILRAGQDFRREAPAPEGVVDAPGHTDLMVTPESIDAFMEANPLPRPDAGGGVREAEHKVERILTRRVLQGRVDGYTLETSKEIVAALSTPPAAAESNASVEQTITEEPDGGILIDAYAGWSREQLKDRCRELLSLASVEARLREALIALDERLRSCGSLHTAEDAYDSFYQEIVSEALSAAGDEAKKSESGLVREEIQRLNEQHETISAYEDEFLSSDPTADRREVVARIVRLFIGAEVQRTEYGVRYSSEAFDKMVGELAALDGGAGA